MKFIISIKKTIKRCLPWPFEMFLFCKYYFIRKKIAFRMKGIRRKNKIRFLFVLNDLSVFKAESLYLQMLKHPRFEPILGISKNIEMPEAEKKVVEYLENKGYNYLILDENRTLSECINPDIVMYQKPYGGGNVCDKHTLFRNRNIIVVHMPYGFHMTLKDWAINQPIYLYAYQHYFENELTMLPFKKMAYNHGQNIVITGIPSMDNLAKHKDCFKDIWNDTHERCRIIWAPHHTIDDMHLPGIAYGTFLKTAEFMLEMAVKYKEKVFFAFKPHPLLYKNLIKVWGKEKTDNYYNRWKTMENTQYVEGAYMELFKHSDAMIHDCGTFTMEYLAIGKPVMYIMRKEHKLNNVNECVKKALQLHYIAYDTQDIEQFIQNVINGIDPMKEEREKFYNDYLIPPHGKTACENIINAILGEAEYKDK